VVAAVEIVGARRGEHVGDGTAGGSADGDSSDHETAGGAIVKVKRMGAVGGQNDRVAHMGGKAQGPAGHRGSSAGRVDEPAG
jgi:hypothetical protein